MREINLTKIVSILIITIISLLFLKCLYTYVLNEVVRYYYSEKVYENKLVKGLYFLNVFEPEIAYYNEGNLLYKQENYEEAVKYYEKALTLNRKQAEVKNKITSKPGLSDAKLCPIINNYILSSMHLITASCDQETISNLNGYLSILYEYGCAGEEDATGSYENSDLLEQDIIAAIAGLEEYCSGGGSDSDDQQEDEEQEQEDNELKDKLQEQEKESQVQRQKEEEESQDQSNWNSVPW